MPRRKNTGEGGAYDENAADATTKSIYMYEFSYDAIVWNKYMVLSAEVLAGDGSVLSSTNCNNVNAADPSGDGSSDANHHNFVVID